MEKQFKIGFEGTALGVTTVAIIKDHVFNDELAAEYAIEELLKLNPGTTYIILPTYSKK